MYAEAHERLAGAIADHALDSGVGLERKATFNLGALIEEVAADADYEARSRRRSVRVIGLQDCLVEGVRETVRGAIENVVRNAIQKTREARQTYEENKATQRTYLRPGERVETT